MKENLSYNATPQLATIKLFEMGCHIQITLDITRLSTQYSPAAINHQVDLLTNSVQQQITDWINIFSRFNETSELMRLNNHTDQWVNVSTELFEVLQLAIYFVPKTQGLVTPTLLKSMWAAGYKQSFATLPKHSMSPLTALNSNATPNLREKSSVDNVNQYIERIQLRLLDNGQHQVYLPAGTTLDLNGYVKGWCAMQLAEQVSQVHDWHIPCLVDMGGDISIGVPSDQIDKPIVWGITVARPYLTNNDPVQDEEDVATLAIDSGGIATSGQDYRRWWHEGQWQHHLIHPHYSRPATSDILTATVLATDTLTAEIYAKYCVLLGGKQAMAWLNKNHIAAILINTDHQVLASPAIYSNLVHLDSMAI